MAYIADTTSGPRLHISKTVSAKLIRAAENCDHPTFHSEMPVLARTPPLILSIGLNDKDNPRS